MRGSALGFRGPGGHSKWQPLVAEAANSNPRATFSCRASLAEAQLGLQPFLQMGRFFFADSMLSTPKVCSAGGSCQSSSANMVGVTLVRLRADPSGKEGGSLRINHCLAAL